MASENHEHEGDECVSERSGTSECSKQGGSPVSLIRIKMKTLDAVECEPRRPRPDKQLNITF